MHELPHPEHQVSRRYDSAILATTSDTVRRQSRAAQPVTTLRGAGVEVDIARAGRAFVAICLAALALTVVIVFLAALHKNDQISALHRDGVPVTLTVSRCTGLLGGSGSNAAGYTCSGTFTVDGRRYEETIPGNVLRPPGQTVAGVAVAGDPPLLTTASMLRGEYTSWRVFVLPGVLFAVLATASIWLALRRPKPRRA